MGRFCIAGRNEPLFNLYQSTPKKALVCVPVTECGIRSVAMESTSAYWIPVYQILESRGLEVCLVNAHHVKNVPGRKTDVSDCQWLQYLHSVGLLRASFRPPGFICAIRSLWRHRSSLIQMAAEHVLHMQKALDQMNLQIHRVLIGEIDSEDSIQLTAEVERLRLITGAVDMRKPWFVGVNSQLRAMLSAQISLLFSGTSFFVVGLVTLAVAAIRWHSGRRSGGVRAVVYLGIWSTMYGINRLAECSALVTTLPHWPPRRRFRSSAEGICGPASEN